MALPLTPTNPKAPVGEIKMFLKSLHEFPDGPSVTSAPISFASKLQKVGWINEWEKNLKDGQKPNMDFGQYFTYCESLGEKYKDGTRNRIGLVNRPVDNWVGKTKAETDYHVAAWHAIGVAWIRVPSFTQGKDLVIFDVENGRPDDPGI